MSVISAACCARTSPTTTPRALTRPYVTRAPFPATSTPRRWGTSSRSRWWPACITATTAPPEPRPKPPSSLTEATTATRRGFRADEVSARSRLTRHDHRARSDAGLSGGRKPCRRTDGIVDRDTHPLPDEGLTPAAGGGRPATWCDAAGLPTRGAHRSTRRRPRAHGR